MMSPDWVTSLIIPCLGWKLSPSVTHGPVSQVWSASPFPQPADRLRRRSGWIWWVLQVRVPPHTHARSSGSLPAARFYLQHDSQRRHQASPTQSLSVMLMQWNNQPLGGVPKPSRCYLPSYLFQKKTSCTLSRSEMTRHAVNSSSHLHYSSYKRSFLHQPLVAPLSKY